jgi:hypothetical protein
MNVSQEQRAIEEAAVRAVRATRARDEATAPARHSQQTDQCPNIARFTMVNKFGARWSTAELAHIGGCPFCARVKQMFADAMKEVAQDETVVDLSANSEETVTEMKGRKPAKPDTPGDAPKPG